jgi:hypothetical protein
MATRRRKLVSRDKPPPPAVELRGGRLWPLTPYDAEAMQAFSDGTTFELHAQVQRSTPQNRRYWKILNEVVKATGKWPRAENLHNNLKITLGYCTMGIDFVTGEPVRIPDSTDFNSMSHRDFCEYHNRAMDYLSHVLGFDPEDLLR